VQAKVVETREVRRSFGGNALLRVRATVAHDSYERLMTVPCLHEEHQSSFGQPALAPLAKTIESPDVVGINIEKLVQAPI